MITPRRRSPFHAYYHQHYLIISFTTIKTNDDISLVIVNKTRHDLLILMIFFNGFHNDQLYDMSL